MGTNRYTQLTPSKFNPLSLNEVMMVPLAKQQQHDATLEGIAAQGAFDVNRLQVDDELVSKGLEDYRTKLTAIEDSLMGQGVGRNTTKQLLNLKRERDKNMSQDGDWGKAQNAYNAYQANIEQLNKNKNLSASDRQLFGKFALSRYKGVKSGDSYQNYLGADPMNGLDYLNPMLKAMPPQTLKGIIMENDKLVQKYGHYYKDKVGGIDVFLRDNYETITKDPEVLATYGQSVLMNNSDYVNYHTEIARASGVNPMDYLSQKIQSDAQNAAYLNAQDDIKYSQDLKNVPRVNTGSGAGPVQPNSPIYDMVKAYRTKKIQKEIESLDILDKIGTPTILEDPTINTRSALKGGLAGYYAGETKEEKKARIEAAKKEKRVYSKDNIQNKEQLKRFEKVASYLKNNKKIDSDDLNDPNVAKAVKSYFELYGNYNHVNTVVSDVTKAIGEYSIGDTSDKNKVLSNVRTSKFNQHYVIGNQTYSYEDLVKKFKGEVKIQDIQGYFDMNNNFPELVKENEKYKSFSSEFVSPLGVVLTTPDGEVIPNVAMTRMTSEKDTPMYKADVVLYDVLQAARDLPGIENNSPIGKVEMVPANSFNGSDYDLKSSENLYKLNGIPYTKTELQAIIRNMF